MSTSSDRIRLTPSPILLLRRSQVFRHAKSSIHFCQPGDGWRNVTRAFFKATNRDLDRVLSAGIAECQAEIEGAHFELFADGGEFLTGHDIHLIHFSSATCSFTLLEAHLVAGREYKFDCIAWRAIFLRLASKYHESLVLRGRLTRSGSRAMIALMFMDYRQLYVSRVCAHHDL